MSSRRKGALSLFETSKRQCLRLSYLLDDVGEAPYELVEPILRKVSAKQLVLIERKCPQVRAKSQVLWKQFIARDFPERPMPESSFKKTYIKYYQQKATQLEDASSRLRESMERIKREKAARTITSLEVDPRAERSAKRQRQHVSMGSGSRLLQKALLTAKSKGPIFSSKNAKFVSSVPKLKVNRDVTGRPDNVDTNSGAILKSRDTRDTTTKGSQLMSEGIKLGLNSRSKLDDSNKAQMVLKDTLKGTDQPSPKPGTSPHGPSPHGPSPHGPPPHNLVRRKKQPSIFLPRRPLGSS